MIGTLFGLVKMVPGATWRYLAIGLLGLGIVWYIYDQGRGAAEARHEAAEAQRALAVAAEQVKRLSALQAAADEAVRASQREQRQTTIIRERILQVTDESACLDRPFPEEALDALRE